MQLETLGQRACAAKPELAKMSTITKNEVLKKAAADLLENWPQIEEANQKDLQKARENGMPPALQDRLALSKSRMEGIVEGMLQVAALEDPIGAVSDMKKRPNGLLIGKKRVPLGVVGVIYEARPNVTADVFALTFKAGNAVLLKGGSDALESNKAIVKSIRSSLEEMGVNPDALILIEDTSRQTAKEFMKMNEYVDVLIPRGGAGLINSTVENATIPVIETGTGNCHIFVDETADLNQAVDIIVNAKTQRIGVCNACESLVIHEKIIDDLLPVLKQRLQEKGVEMRADEKILEAAPELKAAGEDDWGREYLDYIISMKSVKDIDEAIAHINTYSTGHSEAICTRDYENAQKFLDEIDSAAVYVNASTRFTDGFEYGLGAEIGISTQKLHARGPMGLEALTTTKFIIYGSGQVRP